MATNLPSYFFIQFLEQLLKFLVYLLKYVKSQRSYGFLITKELIFGFQILDLKDHFAASLSSHYSSSDQNVDVSPVIYALQINLSLFSARLNRYYFKISFDWKGLTEK